MVFQNYALYPHKTVEANMAFSLKMRKLEKNVIKDKISTAAEVLGLTPYLKRYPRALSGGQRQAISITRTLITEPNILLLDEPTSSMDPQTEKFVLKNIKNWMKNKTVVIATHRGQILDLVERVIILDSGKLVADGKKEEILKSFKTGIKNVFFVNLGQIKAPFDSTLFM